MRTVKSYQLSDGRSEFTGRRLLSAQKIGKRIPDSSKPILSESEILKSQIKFADGRKTAFDEVSPIFEANAGKSVDLKGIKINQFGEIEREEGVTV
ncbi:MAG: hypothetical protein IKM43_02305 [Clostridia bacterium]|nr:hypothetical protein [Clostridia bacterium]